LLTEKNLLLWWCCWFVGAAAEPLRLRAAGGTSLACLLGALAAAPGSVAAGASPDCFPGCVSSLVISISGWPRILPVRLESSFLRWRCAVRVNGILTSHLARCFAAVARPSCGLSRKFPGGHCASLSGARQVVLRVVWTDVRRHCRCHCPAIAGTLSGHDVRHFAGFLAGCFAPISRPSRGTPRSFRRDMSEP